MPRAVSLVAPCGGLAMKKSWKSEAERRERAAVRYAVAGVVEAQEVSGGKTADIRLVRAVDAELLEAFADGPAEGWFTKALKQARR